MTDPHLPRALRILARDIHCEDGIATQCCREAAEEIERLRSLPCPYVTGNVTRYCTLTPFTLTDAEREAIEVAAEAYASDHGERFAATLRGLLDRTGGGE